MQTALPNQDLIRNLIENYYSDSIKPRDGEFISSHWHHYNNLFNVEVDAQGNLVSLSGVGFGEVRWSRKPIVRLIKKGLTQLCIASHLTHLPNRKELLQLRAIAAQVGAAIGLDLTFDVFRQVCTLELLKRKLPDHMRNKRLHVLMIGDGYGVLSALFKSLFPNSTIVMVDLGKTLLFQAYYCQKAHPDCVHQRVESSRVNMVTDLKSLDFVYCPTEELDLLKRFRFDIAINVASMQEMNIATIARYFTFLRSHLQPDNLFYCCNRESKTLPGGEISEFLKYPWQDDDRHLVDQSCPWHQYFFSVGRAKNGLDVFGIRVPFVNFYDGKHMHRLTIMATN